jgi:hypothetical protein
MKYDKKTYKPTIQDAAAAIRRVRLLNIANGGKHETSMIVRALRETDESILASLPKKPEPKDEPVPEVEEVA